MVVTASFFASASGNTVIVAGEVTGAVNTLILNIDISTTVRWLASHTAGAVSDGLPLIYLSGSGTFEVQQEV